MREYVFVCSKNVSRSIYAEKYFRDFLKERGLEGNVSSAGISGGTVFNKTIAEKSDLIFVMEEWMKKAILEDYKVDENKIVVLDILDIYSNGEFTQAYLDLLLRFTKGSKEQEAIKNRPEIKQRLSIKQILDMKGLEGYLSNHQ